MEGCYTSSNVGYGHSPSLSPLIKSDLSGDMNNFVFSGVDIDPLSSYLTFNSCSPTYKDYPTYACKSEKGHDMADVLLSLKHAVLHPGQTNPTQSDQLSPLSSMTHPHYGQGVSMGFGMTPQQSTPNAAPGVSYSIYPQIQLTSNGTQPTGVYYPADYVATQTPGNTQTFPASMSVNLSMNMTMGMPGFGDQFANPQTVTASPQVQWSASAAPSCQYSATNSTPSYAQLSYPSSPTYSASGNPGTYMFTAEFRPQPEAVTLPPIEKEFTMMPSSFKHVKMTDSYPYQATVKSKPKSPPPCRMFQEIGTTCGNFKANLCRVCGKTYARPSTLKTHMRTHSGERPYRCCTCNKSFSQAANLTAHIRTHSGEKPFRCHVCDRRFSQSSSVTTHMRTHSGERPYRCCMCKKAFSDSSTLTKHLRIHSGEKPYQCRLCLLRFSQSGNLNRHMRVHVSPAS